MSSDRRLFTRGLAVVSRKTNKTVSFWFFKAGGVKQGFVNNRGEFSTNLIARPIDRIVNRGGKFESGAKRDYAIVRM